MTLSIPEIIKEFEELFGSFPTSAHWFVQVQSFLHLSLTRYRSELIEEMMLENACPNPHPYASEMCPCRIAAQDEMWKKAEKLT